MFLIYIIPRKLYTIFQSTIFPIKRYQDILFKPLTLSTDSVTKKIIVVCTVYSYNSGSFFATKNFVTESVLKVRSFRRISWHHLIEKNVGWKMVYNFLGKDEKNPGEISTYFRLKHRVSKPKQCDYPP